MAQGLAVHDVWGGPGLVTHQAGLRATVESLVGPGASVTFLRATARASTAYAISWYANERKNAPTPNPISDPVSACASCGGPRDFTGSLPWPRTTDRRATNAVAMTATKKNNPGSPSSAPI